MLHLECVAQRERYQVGVEIPRIEDVLYDAWIWIFMIPVISPIGFSCPVFCEPVFESGVGLQELRIERTGRRVGGNDQNRTAGASEVGSDVRSQSPHRFPIQVKMPEMRIIVVNRELLDQRGTGALIDT